MKPRPPRRVSGLELLAGCAYALTRLSVVALLAAILVWLIVLVWRTG